MFRMGRRTAGLQSGKMQAGGTVIPLQLLVGFVGLAPLAVAAVSSFFSDVYGHRVPVGLDNYRYIFSDPAYLYSLNISLLWALLSTTLTVGLSVFLAAFLQRRRSGWLYAALLVPWLLPSYIAVPLWRALIHGDGNRSVVSVILGREVNLLLQPGAAWAACLFTSFWTAAPMTSVLLAGAMGKIPANCLDAARLDGADRGLILRYIILPQIRSALPAAAVPAFIKALKEFSLIFMLTAGGPVTIAGMTPRHIVGATTTLGIFLHEIFAESRDFGLVSAFSVVTALPVGIGLAAWLLGQSRQRKLQTQKNSAKRLPQVHPSPAYNAESVHKLRILSRSLCSKLRVLPSLCMQQSLRMQTQIPTRAHSQPHMHKHKHKLRNRNIRSSRIVHAVWRTAPTLCAAGYGLITLTAVGFLILISLGKLNVLSPGALILNGPTLRHFSELTTRPELIRSLGNSLFLSCCAALLIIPMVLPAAVRKNGRAGEQGASVSVGVQTLSLFGGIHTLIPLYIISVSLGLSGSYIPLILIAVYQALPRTLFMTRSFLDGVPRSLYEQSMIEGCTGFRFLLQILLPLCRPVLISSAMVAFLCAWNGFTAPLLFINSERAYTFGLSLFSLLGKLGSASPEWNLFAAASLLNLAVLGLLFGRLRNASLRSPLKDHF